SIGIEMIADFDKEDDDSGTGLLIKNNAIALCALLCEKLNLNPELAIRLHKEDHKTTHKCPGDKFAVDRTQVIQKVLEYMGHAGEHVGDQPLEVAKTRKGIVQVPQNDVLNLREKSSASSKIIDRLVPNALVKILNEGQNGSTLWYFIEVNGTRGWAAAK